MQFDLLSRRITINTKLGRTMRRIEESSIICVTPLHLPSVSEIFRGVSDSEVLAAAIYILDSCSTLRGVGIQSSVTPRTCIFSRYLAITP